MSQLSTLLDVASIHIDNRVDKLGVCSSDRNYRRLILFGGSGNTLQDVTTSDHPFGLVVTRSADICLRMVVDCIKFDS